MFLSVILRRRELRDFVTADIDGRCENRDSRELRAFSVAATDPPPPVNTTSSAAEPSSAATWPRAFSKAAFARVLAQWPLEGLP